MPVDFPAHISIKGFSYCISLLAHIHRYVMFEAHSADVLQKILEVGDFNHAVAAKGFELIICKLAFADIGTYNTGGIIGGGSAEGRLFGGNSANNRAISIFFSNSTGDNLLEVHFCLLEE